MLTHFDWMLQPLRYDGSARPTDAEQPQIAQLRARQGADADSGGAIPPDTEGRWVARDELDSIGIPAPIRKLLDAAL